MRLQNCTDANLMTGTAWGWLDPGALKQPAQVELSNPETGAFIRYWPSLLATTPTVNGKALSPGASVIQPLRPGEHVWYKFSTASPVSGNAQTCQ
jgi:hypothetical protein